MIQRKTKIVIKDNSGFLKSYCINSHPRNKGARVGHSLKVAITKSKNALSQSSSSRGSSPSQKECVTNLLIIHTRCPISRYDGSFIRFHYNSGVSILLKKTLKNPIQFGFKRINTALPFELRKRSHWQGFQGTLNITKLAKSLI